MNQLIKIESDNIGGTVRPTANARDLHAFLGSKQEFSAWIKGRITQYDFVAEQDFTVDKFINGRATQIDYHISIDMAKELAMVERNAKGKEARQYFIECERRALAAAPVVAVLSPAEMFLQNAQLLASIESRAAQLETTKPTVAWLNWLFELRPAIGQLSTTNS